jgi:hypothetical protein
MDLSHGFRISEIPMGKYMMDSAVKPVSYENRAQLLKGSFCTFFPYKLLFLFG